MSHLMPGCASSRTTSPVSFLLLAASQATLDSTLSTIAPPYAIKYSLFFAGAGAARLTNNPTKFSNARPWLNYEH